MTISIYGEQIQDPLPVDFRYKQRVIKKIEAIAKAYSVEAKNSHGEHGQSGRQQSAAQAYGATERLQTRPATLVAQQVMTAPVVTLTPEATFAEAFDQFRTKSFRHLPVVSSSGHLVGIISERDILRYMAGLTAAYERQPAMDAEEARVDQVMIPRVLTASVDTEVRNIARLFAEHRIGAVPIVKNQLLEGILTRGDVLAAVMRHYMELWA